MMRATEAIFTSLAIGLAAVSACSKGSSTSELNALLDEEAEYWLAGPDPTSERAGDGTSDLLFKISKSDEKVRSLFEWEPESAKRIYEDSRERWRTRFNGCQDARCRYERARKELNRLNFVLNRASMPIPGIPFKGGFFEAKVGEMSGYVHVIPIENGHALMILDTIQVNPSLATCEVTTFGRFPNRGAARMMEVPEDYSSDERAQIQVVVHSDREMSLNQVLDVDKIVVICGVSGFFAAKYVLVE